jgi:hypothetical protein
MPEVVKNGRNGDIGLNATLPSSKICLKRHLLTYSMDQSPS